LTGIMQFEQEGPMRLTVLLLAVSLGACASTQPDDALELTYYYLRF